MSNSQAVQEGLAYLASLAKFGMEPTLDRIEALLAALRQPQETYPIVHVTGTNGKGSTCKLIATALAHSGLRVGLFTSPHLVEYNERIAVNGEPISDEQLLGLVNQVKELVPGVVHQVGHPTEFEISTAMAFLHFAQAQVDVAVIEVGMGGLWDSTNVVKPVVSVITPVGMDHMDRLGNALAEIATQKAGIIKPGAPVVCALQEPEAARVIAQAAQTDASPLVWVTEQGATAPSGGTVATYEPVRWDAHGGVFHLSGPREHWSDLQVGLLGKHQLANAAIAATVCQLLAEQGIPVGEADVRSAFTDTVWPGRLEVIGRSPLVMLDGAHNAQGAQVLSQALRDLFAGKKITLVLGMLAEKQVDDVLTLLLPVADNLVCTAPAHGRTPPLLPAELTARACAVAGRLGLDIKITEHPGAWEALQWAQEQAAGDDVVCMCGSLYMIGEVRARLA